MIFGWLRRRRRRKLLELPFPERWSKFLSEHVPFYASLGDDARKRLQGIARVLVAEKHWEGCRGLEITDEIRIHIAAQAARLILNIDHNYYCGVRSIFVYPSTFVLPESRVHGRILIEGETPVLGLAAHRGPIVLAWDEARHGAFNPADGRNVVYHEFAHKLDMLDDFADGTPPLHEREQYGAWSRIMTESYNSLREDARRGRATLLDRYGAEEPAEFFAVATEVFFEKSRTLKRRHAELYALLVDYFRQDPAAEE